MGNEKGNKKREHEITSWIDRAKAIGKQGHTMFSELIDVRLEYNGILVGYFDSMKDAIRYAEENLPCMCD